MMDHEPDEDDEGEYRHAPGHPDNKMHEYNPDEWDPEPTDPDRGRGTVNTWDPIAGTDVNVPGDPHDRDPDMSEDHARRLALRGDFDRLDDDQPLPLLSSSMRADPSEGVQGTYSKVTRLDDPCDECLNSYGVLSVHTLAGVHRVKCLLCGAGIEP